MNDNYAKAQECLEIILKYGDLYDVIAKKINLNPKENALLRVNILFFSRIIYAAVLTGEKIISLFSPIEKVKNAQDEIRKILGVKVDIIRTKSSADVGRKILFNNNHQLFLLYENDGADRLNYIADLKKIAAFCNLHQIEKIILRYSDITDLFADVDLSDFSMTNTQNIMGEVFPENKSVRLLRLSYNELLKLIDVLQLSCAEKRIIVDLGKKVNDPVVKNAFADFLKNHDLKKFKKLLQIRLSLYLNNGTSFKDRQLGKIYKVVNLQDKYVQVIEIDKSGQKIGDSIMLLCDYLGSPNLKDLIMKVEYNQDELDLLIMAALYLYICKPEKIKQKVNKNYESFYDRVYAQYQAKKANRKAKMDLMYAKALLYNEHIAVLGVSAILTAILTASVVSAGFMINFIQENIFDKEFIPIEECFSKVYGLYASSWNVEKEILLSLWDYSKGTRGFALDAYQSLIGDIFPGFYDERGQRIVAIINPRYESYLIPNYYAQGYATKASYNKGELIYDIQVPLVDYSLFDQVPSIFSISYFIDRNDFRSLIENNTINLPYGLYPVGFNYAIEKIEIKDYNHPENVLVIDYDRAINKGNALTDEEVSMLKKMKKPEIETFYGISFDKENAFASKMTKEGPYMQSPREELEQIIIAQLGLSPDASLYDILKAIEAKEYSLTPLKDAGLKYKVRKMDEKEYFATIAALESYICNLSASLVAQLDDDYIYVSGFYDTDYYITEDEAHAWVMDSSANILDATPQNDNIDEESKMSKALNNFIKWGIDNRIPIITFLFILSLLVYKRFGKKIKFSIKSWQIAKLLNNENLDEAYAQLKDILFKGINIPRKRDALTFIDTVTSEFSGYQDYVFKNLYQEFKNMDIGPNKGLIMKVVKEIPYIKDNSNTLKRTLKKKKK